MAFFNYQLVKTEQKIHFSSKKNGKLPVHIPLGGQLALVIRPCHSVIPLFSLLKGDLPSLLRDPLKFGITVGMEKYF